MNPTARLLALLVVLGWLGASIPVRAQGTFNFSNVVVPGQPRVLDEAGQSMAGTGYQIEVLVLDPATGQYRSDLLKVTTSGKFPAAPVSPLTGAHAGLFAGGTVEVPFLAAGAKADVWVRAWKVGTNPGFDCATYYGGVRFAVAALGGAGSPATMQAFASFGIGAPLTILRYPKPRMRVVAGEVRLEWSDPCNVAPGKVRWLYAVSRSPALPDFGSFRELACGDDACRAARALVFKDDAPVRDPATGTYSIRLDPRGPDASFVWILGHYLDPVPCCH